VESKGIFNSNVNEGLSEIDRGKIAMKRRRGERQTHKRRKCDEEVREKYMRRSDVGKMQGVEESRENTYEVMWGICDEE
jgi:hypothetical protein